jgi:hypothetical protein
MNNSLLINKLKQKSNYNQQLVDKYNPDIIDNHSNIIKKREDINYNFSNIVWKPIIGSINKTNITTDDLLIEIPDIDPEEINSSYEQQLEEREKEKQLAEKLSQEYAENNLQIPEIEIPELDNNTFIDLKITANEILKDTNNINTDLIMESITKLDDLLDAINNL